MVAFRGQDLPVQHTIHEIQKWKYISELQNKEIISFVKFRCCQNYLPVANYTDSDTLCDSVGNEIHYLLKCAYFQNERRKVIDDKFIKYPTQLSFIELKKKKKKKRNKIYNYYITKS